MKFSQGIWIVLAVPLALGAAQGGAKSAAPAPSAAGAPIVVGVIDDEIGHATSAYVTRLLEAARSQKAQALVIEINTFGGRVDAAVAIRDALLDAPLVTVAFINKRAISAGALISLACKKIVITAGGTIGAAMPVQMAPGDSAAKPVEEKYISYFREEMRSTAEARGRNGDIAEAMVDADKEIKGLSPKGKLLTLTTESALKHRIADAQAETLEGALAAMGLSGPLVRVSRNWSEELVGYLTSQAVASLLFMLMVVLAYLEYQAPGFGVFGFGAIACFLVLFFSHYLVNLAGLEEIILFAVGVALLLVELFVIPGFGIAGILGILCILAAAVLLLLAGDPLELDFDNPFLRGAMIEVLGSAVGAVVVLGLLARFLPKEASRSGLVLGGRLAAGGGFAARDASSVEALLGAEGEALTPLRPSGKARLQNQRIEVQSEGDFIAAGERVRVVAAAPGKIIVRRAG